MKTKTLLTALAATAVLTAGSVTQAATIGLADLSLTPDGTGAVSNQDTNVNVLNGNASVLPAGGTSVAYVVSTFTFGTNSDAHLAWRFYVNAPTSAPRLGVQVQDSGQVTFLGTGDGSQTSVNLGELAGQTVVLLAKLDYDVNRSTPGAPIGGNTSNDTLMNVWVNPDGSSTEGAGTSAGDMSTIWNSAGFNHFRQAIENQSTPGTAGSSTITDTVILTGSEATFANALLAAGVPEPSSLALLGLGGLLITRRRRG